MYGCTHQYQNLLHAYKTNGIQNLCQYEKHVGIIIVEKGLFTFGYNPNIKL